MKKTLKSRKAGRHYADEKGNITKSEGGTVRDPAEIEKLNKPQQKQEKGNADKA